MTALLPEELRRVWFAASSLPLWRMEDFLRDTEDLSRIEEAFLRRDPALQACLTESEWRQMAESHSVSRLEQIRAEMERHEMGLLTVLDEAYPERLRNIKDPPAALFYQGSLSALDRHTVAMVGSRRATYDGLKATEKKAEQLSRRGVTVISGLAYGIDAAAHRGCLKGEAPTIAVLGCGLDQMYPAGNAGLKREILKGGGLIFSEYLPGEKPLAAHFPIRNRIISGLGEAVILMEARMPSGSMRTVEHALEQGRELFVYPGDPESEAFSANHILLREGARFFTQVSHVMEDMGWTDPEDTSLRGLDNGDDVRQNVGCSGEGAALSENEQKVLEALRPGELGFDELTEKTGIPAGALSGTLTMMQIRGLIAAKPGKRFAAAGK